jgi:hypothetical protein
MFYVFFLCSFNIMIDEIYIMKCLEIDGKESEKGGKNGKTKNIHFALHSI